MTEISPRPLVLRIILLGLALIVIAALVLAGCSAETGTQAVNDVMRG